jgi:hypothetical protein
MTLACDEGEIVFAVAADPSADFTCINVDGVVRHRRGDWSFRARYCTAEHLATLADWFDAVAAGRTPEMCIVGGFLCHELVFHVRGGSYYTYYEETFSPLSTDVYRVTFGGDTRPPWIDERCGEGWGFMDFPIDAPAMRATAAELREQLRKQAAL